MSLPSVEDEQNEYYHAEIESRFTKEEAMEEFVKLMKERIYKQDADAIDWAMECMLDKVDISDMKDELVYAYKTKEWDYE
jgi:hypothetical protein